MQGTVAVPSRMRTVPPTPSQEKIVLKLVSLGGSGSTCKPLARVGDLAGTWIKPSPFAPTILVGVVTTGSSRVLACG